MKSLEFAPQQNTNIQARDIACNLELSLRKERSQGLKILKISQELKNKNFVLRNTQTREEKSGNLEEIIRAIRENL